jgi:hypothetical protein
MSRHNSEADIKRQCRIGGVMDVDYFSCSACDHQDFNIFVAYSRATANDDWYICPSCGEESRDIEVSE